MLSELEELQDELQTYLLQLELESPAHRVPAHDCECWRQDAPCMARKVLGVLDGFLGSREWIEHGYGTQPRTMTLAESLMRADDKEAV